MYQLFINFTYIRLQRNWVIFIANRIVVFLKSRDYICRAFPNSLLCVILASNHLPFFKIFSNFVHFCSNFQIFCPFLTLFPPFFALFLKNHMHALTFYNWPWFATFKGTVSDRRQILATESPVKIIENYFYFTLKALFVLKILKFLLNFWSCRKMTWLER